MVKLDSRSILKERINSSKTEELLSSLAGTTDRVSRRSVYVISRVPQGYTLFNYYSMSPVISDIPKLRWSRWISDCMNFDSHYQRFFSAELIQNLCNRYQRLMIDIPIYKHHIASNPDPDVRALNQTRLIESVYKMKSIEQEIGYCTRFARSRRNDK